MVHRPLWQAAAAFAARAHRHQIRKDGETPYVAHPVRVALTVALVFEHTDEETLAAALLHDVIEDTGADYDDVLELCGRYVADLVAAMTKDMRLIEPQREEQYDAQLAAAPWQARLIKLADVYDNFADAIGHPKRETDFRKKADRALQLAQGEPRLEKAAAALRALLSDPPRP